MSDDTLTITLKTPIAFENQTYSEITLREPTAGELAKAVRGENPVAIGVILVAEVSGVPERAINMLAGSDLNRATGFVAPFYARATSDDCLVVSEDDPGCATLTLRAPLKVDGREISELKLREPTAGELRAAADGDNAIETDIRLLAIIGRVPRSAIAGMPARELMAASRFFSDSTRVAPPGGSGS